MSLHQLSHLLAHHSLPISSNTTSKCHIYFFTSHLFTSPARTYAWQGQGPGLLQAACLAPGTVFSTWQVLCKHLLNGGVKRWGSPWLGYGVQLLNHRKSQEGESWNIKITSAQGNQTYGKRLTELELMRKHSIFMLQGEWKFSFPNACVCVCVCVCVRARVRVCVSRLVMSDSLRPKGWRLNKKKWTLGS